MHAPAPIRLTPALRTQIHAAVRAHVRGASPLAEVGLRGDDTWEPNALNWTADTDLGDLVRLSALKVIDSCPAHPTCAELDLYVTTGTGSSRELETNVCILIRDGVVVGATSEGRDVLALKARLQFPTGPWDFA